MAKEPAGKKPALRNTVVPKPAAPKRAAGRATPTAESPAKPAEKKAVTRRQAKPPAKKQARKAAQPPKKTAPLQAERAQLGLTAKQEKFVDEYLVDLNATQAAIRAGYSPGTARQMGAENLSKPDIQLAVSEARKRQQARTEITADRVLQEIVSVALADARELVEVRTGCCRCCHGYGHKYQRTVGEMNRDREDWVEKGKNPAEFDEAGGIGFNPLLQPNPECPHCGGDGAPRMVLKDTRKISGAAAALYAGAKQTKEGIEIKMHSKMDAIEKLAKHLGLYELDNKQKTDPLTDLLHQIAKSSGNAFQPVAEDPEHRPRASGSSSVQPVADPDASG